MMKLLPRLAQVAVWVTIAAGALVLAGWFLGIQALIHLLPSRVAMNPMTALSFLLCGVALCCLHCGTARGARWRIWAGLTLAVLVFAIGGLRIADYLGGFRFHVDELLFPRRLALTGPYTLDEMAPNAAVDFILLGLGLLLFRAERPRLVLAAQTAVLTAGLVALLALIGYTYRELMLYRLGTAVPMGLASAILFSLLSAGYLAAQPTRGVMEVVTSRTTGGTMARRLLPMAVLVPWLLGAFLVLGEQAGYYQPEFTISIFAIASIVIFSLLIWLHAKLLYLADLDRVQAERRLAAQHQATRLLAESSNLAEVLPKFLQTICDSLNWGFGAFWTPDARSATLRCEQMWYGSGLGGNALVEATRTSAFNKGAGLPGRVWAQAHVTWEFEEDNLSGRGAIATAAGLYLGLGVPVWLEQRVFGVLEFLSPEARPPETALLEMLAVIGTQLGLFIERTRAEDQLRQATANLQRSNTELQQFASIASHDLFEPLRMVTSYLELLREHAGGQLDARGAEFIGFALDGAKRMVVLIRDLLAYSRVDLRGGSFGSVNCAQIFDAALANLKVAVEETRAVVSHGPLPMVLGDGIQLTQVFQNLIGNALKFHGSAPPRVEATAERRDREWLFRVHDNGIGIDPKHFGRLFVIFQRLHTPQEYAGTGMGLAICKKIIERHGGRIWVESTPGKGSTFLFTLPVLKP